MVRRYLLMMAGVMLYFFPARSQTLVQGLEKTEIAMLLRKLQKIPTLSCIADRVDFQYPWKREDLFQLQKEQFTCFQQLMFEQIFALFSTEHGLAAWDQSLLKQLLSNLYRSLKNLEPVEEGSLACLSLGIALRKYFRRINLYLNQKKYSDCAWEIVRWEIQFTFFPYNNYQSESSHKRRNE
ncbi:interferon omega-1-like [Suncus etruscus]|uniref:interferon omega-1-like n=1 Tax=Suncus etruscus TaxID=109475 RepID=UPI00210F459D|nr:interferon omega-1-like [Suncus etruscus]